MTVVAVLTIFESVFYRARYLFFAPACEVARTKTAYTETVRIQTGLISPLF